MYYQNKPGIYVYFQKDLYDATGVYRTIKVEFHRHEDFNSFFRFWREHEIKEHIGYFLSDKICREITHIEYRCGFYGGRWARRRSYCNTINCKEHDAKYNKAYVVYDQDGNQYTPDRLVGMRRDWEENQQPRYTTWLRRRNGYKRSAYGGYRKIRTFQERKWAHAWDDEEFAPKVRASRQGHNLPDTWDDIWAHNDKSWKTQSKRRHQWKEKK